MNSLQKLRTMPHSLEAEQAVLGAMLIDAEGSMTENIIAILKKSERFYEPHHQRIFQTILELRQKNEKINILSVFNWAGRPLPMSFLVELASGVATVANAEQHAKIVLDKAILRDLINREMAIIDKCFKEEDSVEDIIQYAEHEIYSIGDRRDVTDFIRIDKIMPDVMESISSAQEGRGLKTGYRDLDNYIMGMQAGDLLLLAGRPSMGKSALAVNICENVARKGMGVAIFSLEMSTERIGQRMLCAAAGVKGRDAQYGRMSDDTWQRLSVTAEGFVNLPLYVDSSGSLSPTEIRGKLRRLSRTMKISLVCVDYIQLMVGDKRSENRNQEISYISSQLKGIAREFNLPVLALCQLSRAVEQRGGPKKPQLCDLRESGALEQDADIVMFIYRPEYYLEDDDPKKEAVENQAQIIIAKHRNGETGSVWLRFNKPMVRFESLSHQSEI